MAEVTCKCEPGRRCVDCGGCECGYYESDCLDPPGCVSIEEAEQHRTEFGPCE